jgi:hypothetical protein
VYAIVDRHLSIDLQFRPALNEAQKQVKVVGSGQARVETAKWHERTLAEESCLEKATQNTSRTGAL